ncbi:MAG: tRNA (adenosine(37)-N6)-threonylcarbamoyltransferase complex transferase subunit TsaD, partial [Patescibacteria group bacterium]
MIILGIETTCDETGVGIVKNGREILANVVASSAAIHKKYGGVVPEIAAREQVRSIIPVTQEGLHRARLTFSDVDQLAVAFGPGLLGSLLVGVEAAKTMAIIFAKQLVPVNHLVGHVYANWLIVESRFLKKSSSQFTEEKTVNRQLKTVNLPQFPIVALIVSGGHTDLILMDGHRDYKWLGGTRDDAAGEAFDKVARILGLGYPGGPEVERVARQFTLRQAQGNTERSRSITVDPLREASRSRLTVRLPRPMISEDNFDFSFSGIKTAVADKLSLRSSSLNPSTSSGLGTAGLRVKSLELRETDTAQIAYEFQNAITDILVVKTL